MGPFFSFCGASLVPRVRDYWGAGISYHVARHTWPPSLARQPLLPKEGETIIAHACHIQISGVARKDTGIKQNLITIHKSFLALVPNGVAVSGKVAKSASL